MNCTIYFDPGSSSGGEIQNSQDTLAFVSVTNFENGTSIMHVINNNNRSSRVEVLNTGSPNNYHLLIDNMVPNQTPV